MDSLLEALRSLLRSNTLLGGDLPPISNIFSQLEALAAFCYPYEDSVKSEGLLFQSPFWDNLDRVPVDRQVFGITQFHNRTQLLLWAMRFDPYKFSTIREFQPIGLVTFPDSKQIYMAKEYKDPRKAIDIVKTYVQKDDTSLVVRADISKKQPTFVIQSCFNPYFQYFRQHEAGVCVSPDLICNQAEMLNMSLIHKDTKFILKRIQQGFNPQVGLNIFPVDKDGIADVKVIELPPGYPYPVKADIDTTETQAASPSNFEL